MDYPSTSSGQVGTELWKYQWDFKHDPEGGCYLWEDVEEGASEEQPQYKFTIAQLEKEVENNITFISYCCDKEVIVQLIEKSTEEPLTVNWLLGDIQLTEKADFTLDTSKAISDTLWVYNTDTEELLASMPISIEEEYMHFLINGRKYEDGQTFVTMYTHKELNIEIVSNNDSIPFSKWEINGNKFEEANNPGILSITLSPAVLPKVGRRERHKNKLTMVGTDNKPIIELLVHTYHPPHLVFTAANHDGSFFWGDQGFTYENLKSPQYYDTIMVKERRTFGGYRDKEVYAPVLGLPQGKEVTLNVEVREFPDYALDDEDFRVVIRGTRNEFVQLNRSPLIELNAHDFQNLTNITVRAEKILNVDNIHIEAIILDADNRIGLVEYYCRNINERYPKLIYVKFKDDTSYPSLCHNQLQTYLNTSATNQLFLDMKIDTVHLYIDKKKSFYEGLANSNTVLQFLKNEYLGHIGYSLNEVENTYYFITDLNLRGENENDFRGGAHMTGAAGGFQARLPASGTTTPQTVTAHEFGHWQGLPHTFEKHNGHIQTMPPGFFPFTKNIKETKDNFMDYDVVLRTWVKFQLLNKKVGPNDL